MANVSRVNGFRPVKHVNGSAWNGQTNLYYVPASDATALFQGDLVKRLAGSSADGYRQITKAAVGDPAIGVVVGFVVNPDNLNLTGQYRPASTARYALVADAPDTIFEAQVSGTVAATLPGKNANHADAGGSTITSQSGETVDASTAATTATLTLKIHDFVQRVDNEVGNASAKVLVQINNHQLGAGTGTAGV